jgi:hypothetical protein
MPKKKPYGGLTRHQVRLIRQYLRTLYGDVPQATSTAALFAWTWLVMDCDGLASMNADAAGLVSGTVKALRAGLEVLKRKRVGRIHDSSPSQSFAAIGIAISL